LYFLWESILDSPLGNPHPNPAYNSNPNPAYNSNPNPAYNSNPMPNASPLHASPSPSHPEQGPLAYPWEAMQDQSVWLRLPVEFHFVYVIFCFLFLVFFFFFLLPYLVLSLTLRAVRTM
jgi:hypothetical protein